jgi:hypothetical protein
MYASRAHLPPITITTKVPSLMPGPNSPYNATVLTYLHDFLNGCVQYGITSIGDIRLELTRYAEDADVNDIVEDMVIALIEEYLDLLEQTLMTMPEAAHYTLLDMAFCKFWFKGNIVACMGYLEV